MKETRIVFMNTASLACLIALVTCLIARGGFGQ